MQPLRLLSKRPFLTSILFLFTTSIFSISAVNAETIEADKSAEKKIEIPVIDDARIFARFDDKAPAVINYFTSATEETVIDFYQKSYGEPIAQERKRGRLTINFSKELQEIRVVISQQNNVRQVDVIVDKSSEI